MAKIVNQHAIVIKHHTTFTTINVRKGSKILDVKWDRWSAQIMVLEDIGGHYIEMEDREIIISATGFTIPTHNESGLLIRVLKHITTIEVSPCEYIHIFENIKR